eukprot:TRINITY_DN1860_c0_g1_i2.p1 TRINITY_DN1860_c0_g1~~TRINITY_DN1860_c0_g1_i2.p1  ORF type:complete len:215 (+),score=17.32 TRINITY_DN1860_c0_g1_i2:70-645(+)
MGDNDSSQLFESIQLLGSELQQGTEFQEIGDMAVWNVTSAKPGNGVELLRDESQETYWQSDGQQPHRISISFRQKVRIHSVVIFLDFKADESYTPQKVQIRIGTNMRDMREVRTVEFEEPVGWVQVPLCQKGGKCAQTFMVQIVVLCNHQNGRDTHIRQIKVFSPREDRYKLMGFPFSFTTEEFRTRALLR